MLSPAYVQSETLGILPATAKPFEILYDLFFHQTICGSPQLVKIAGLSSLTTNWYRRLEQNPSNRALAEIVQGGFFLRKKPQKRGALGVHLLGFCFSGRATPNTAKMM
jgi:hypothetical protein